MPRILSETGASRVKVINKPALKYLFSDPFTTLVDLQWRWIIIIYAVSNWIIWLIFSVAWWTRSYIHGDFLPENLPGGIQQKSGNFTPCVTQLYGFASTGLFSVVTSQTIGYGGRYPTNECLYFSTLAVALQSHISSLLTCILLGIIYAKLSRSKKRAKGFKFSKMAVLYVENEIFHLAVRIGDLAKSRIIGATVTAEIFMKEFDGKRNITVRKPLEVTSENNCGLFFFLGPLIVIHRITPSSPLYQMSPEDHRRKDVEIMIIVTGSTEETGAAMQAISSYKHEQIRWGYKFEEIVKFSKDKNTLEVDYNNFDILKYVSTSV